MNKIINDLLSSKIEITLDKDLRQLSTMRIGSKGRIFTTVKSQVELQNLVNIIKKHNNLNVITIGYGANTVFINDFEGLIIKNEIEGINIVKEDSESVILKVESGENWHKLVTWAVDKNYSGIENLALIPSTVGAAAIQNIAAYGQNIEDVIEELSAINIRTGLLKVFKKDECQFEYRESIFKNKLKGEYIVTDVTFKLSKILNTLETNYHERAGRYASLEDTLKKIAKEPYNIKDVYNAVIHIRNQKLPNIKEIGTCGSFFKNIVVSKEKYKELSSEISDLQSYPVDKLKYNQKDWDNFDSDKVKIPTGRLLDELGWNGKWIGNVGIFKNHALCIVSNGNATPQELVDFINAVKKSIKDRFGLELDNEVVLV